MIMAALALAAGIPQASFDGVGRDGVLRPIPDGRVGLYIQSFKGDWYYASFKGPCARLGDSYGLTFDTSPGDRLDQFSAIIADGERCPFDSLVRSLPPPKRIKR